MDETEARLAPADRGFLLGDGIFETIAVKRGQARRLHAHLARLRRDAAVIDLNMPWPDVTLSSLIERTAQENHLADAAVRLTVTRGPGPRGLLPPNDTQPTLLITAHPLPDMSAPARVIVSAVTRRNALSPLSRIKNTNYLDGIIARQEAAKKNADDAILLNTKDFVAESTVANVFALIDGGLVTPPVEDGALPGVMRADVMKLGRGEERSITPEMLKAANEVFLTNALGLRPVVSIDGAPVGDGEPGLITQLLATRL